MKISQICMTLSVFGVGVLVGGMVVYQACPFPTQPTFVGYRTVTIRTHCEDQPHLQPNQRVDLVVLYTNPFAPGRVISKTFLQNALVLSISPTIVGEKESSPCPSMRYVALAVKPEEAEKVHWAQRQGSISLLIRQPGDNEEVKTFGFTPRF
jgi:Flp pilus assembly protein CpaB